MPRLVPQTAFTSTADRAANKQAEKNAALPQPSQTACFKKEGFSYCFIVNLFHKACYSFNHDILDKWDYSLCPVLSRFCYDKISLPPGIEQATFPTNLGCLGARYRYTVLQI